MKKNIKLFVYGTLKKGFYWHEEYLGESEFIGPCRTSTDFTLYIDALPFLVEEKASEPVIGELYQIDTETLANIDRLEGHPVAYKRDLITVFDEDDNEIKAWAYIYPNVFRGKKHVIKETWYD